MVEGSCVFSDIATGKLLIIFQDLRGKLPAAHFLCVLTSEVERIESTCLSLFQILEMRKTLHLANDIIDPPPSSRGLRLSEGKPSPGSASFRSLP